MLTSMIPIAILAVLTWEFQRCGLPVPTGVHYKVADSIEDVVADSDLIVIGSEGEQLSTTYETVIKPYPHTLDEGSVRWPELVLTDTKSLVDVEAFLLDDGASRPVVYTRHGEPSYRWPEEVRSRPLARRGERFVFFLSREPNDVAQYLLSGSGCSQIAVDEASPKCANWPLVEWSLLNDLTTDEFIRLVERAIASR